MRPVLEYRTGASLPAMFALACLVTACGPNYSPNTYSSNAVQQANKVESGVIIGVRNVAISADETVASATGGAVGGIAGSQVGAGAVSALGAVGGSVTGGLVGNVMGHTTGDTLGYEYIVRKPNGDLLSVTQTDVTPLKIGLHVLIIEGPQARIVNDYTVPIEGEPSKVKPAEAPKPVEAAKPREAPKADKPGAVVVTPAVIVPDEHATAAPPSAPDAKAPDPAPVPAPQ